MVPREHSSVLRQANERFEKELLSQKLLDKEIEHEAKKLTSDQDLKTSNLRLKEQMLREAHFRALRDQIRLNCTSRFKA